MLFLDKRFMENRIIQTLFSVSSYCAINDRHVGQVVLVFLCRQQDFHVENIFYRIRNIDGEKPVWKIKTN